jgi:hypothetical protein
MAKAGEIKLLRETFNPLGQAQLPNGVANIGPPGDEGALFLTTANLREDCHALPAS